MIRIMKRRRRRKKLRLIIDITIKIIHRDKLYSYSPNSFNSEGLFSKSLSKL